MALVHWKYLKRNKQWGIQSNTKPCKRGLQKPVIHYRLGSRNKVWVKNKKPLPCNNTSDQNLSSLAKKLTMDLY